MNVVRCVFAVTVALLSVMETAESEENNTTVVKEAGLRSEGELVQAKEILPSTFEINNDDTHEGLASKPKLNDVYIPSQSIDSSADATPEPSQVKKRHAMQQED